MRKLWMAGLLVLGFAAAPLMPSPLAQEPAGTALELRDAHATLLGLDLDGERIVQDDGADVYRSNLDDPSAPRLLTRLEVARNECRVRTTSALQFPGKWAALSLTLTDFYKVTSAVGYRSVDDLIAEQNPLKPGDPAARQLVLEGKGLRCTTRLSLDVATDEPASTCSDRLDISMMTDVQAKRARRALALMAGKCSIRALQE